MTRPGGGTVAPPADTLFPPRRAEALRRLQGFISNAGPAYAANRNHDAGPGLRENVSMLSPYIRHRVITEREVVATTLQHHSPDAAEKFIQEVFWRTYWKGWLQMRPQVWDSYLEELAVDRSRLATENALSNGVNRAESGQTGIDGFDDWARELVQTGYLHNHARMWFASIWVFTVRLPWTLGADFFLRHLLDADPASNTLGWRWVAGIQTPGKTYRAKPDNIARFTSGRYRPVGLAETAEPIRQETPPKPKPLKAPAQPPVAGPALLLLHGDDLRGDELIPPGTEIRAVAVAAAGHPDTPWPFGERARAFVNDLVADAVQRLKREGQPAVARMQALSAEALRLQCQQAGVRTVITPEAPVGPIAEGLRRVTDVLSTEGIGVIQLRRTWDHLAWPHATHGFFRFRRRIPELLHQNGLIGE